MNKTHYKRFFITGMLAYAGIHFAYAHPGEEVGDTTRIFDIEEITVVASPKEHVRLNEQPLAASLFNAKLIQENRIETLKGVSNLTPNLFIPNYGSSLTSAIYIRGIGSRINSPAVGLYVDNIPYLDKSAFDFNLTDIERIDVLRGPQGTLYGRNTMGGLVRIYTKNPFHHKGTEINLSGSTGDNAGKLSFIHRQLINDRLALSTGGYVQEKRGVFRNMTQNRWSDPKRAAGAHLRTVFLPNDAWKFDFTAAYDYTDEGGYAYRYLGAINPEEEMFNKLKGKISNNRSNGYWRSLFNSGLNVEWKNDNFTLYSSTGYQHVNDCMFIDQDFLAADIFTLRQSQRQHTLSQELSIKSLSPKKWQHTTGIFAFYQWLQTSAPVTFHNEGISMIQNAMDEGMKNSPIQVTLTDEKLYIPGTFDTPTFGAALFHQSTIEIVKGLKATAGIRLNYEKIQIDYNTEATIHGIMNGSVADLVFTDAPFSQHVQYNDQTDKYFVHLLPKIALSYYWDRLSTNNLYASVSKGMRSGGYNIQMFSEIIQTRFRQPGDNSEEVKKLITYKPEQSWNRELGTHVTLWQGRVKADAALFYIITKDQQISRFTPNGLGRIMVNAGKGKSYGAEVSLKFRPDKHWSLFANYGYTHATFSKYDGGVNEKNEVVKYSGNYIPYAPMHTLNVGGGYTIFLPTNSWLQTISIRTDLTGAGRIYWTEQNDSYQNFYHLFNGGITLTNEKLQIDIWTRNLLDKQFNTFCFDSMSRRFAQSGLPRQFGIDIRIKL
ncbi:MAG: TonB-dependent receptor [Bacteroidaceae bacterium]|nr:TonB-dependent receptor [Bacteroidaceae bacterium]